MLHGLAPATADVDRGGTFLVADGCHPQTIEVVRTRARPLGIEVKVGDPAAFDFAAEKAFGLLLQYPATDGAAARLRRSHRAGPRGRRPGGDGHRSAGADGADAAGRARRRRRRRQRAALRRAARLRRSARGLLRHARRVDAQAARAPHRRLRGRARQPRAADGAADPRAAHPPREGDQQHLHGAGAAGRDVRDVRRLSRTARPARDRGARRRLCRGAGARARAPRRPRAPPDLLRHRADRRQRVRGRWLDDGSRGAEDQPAPALERVAHDRARRDDHRGRHRSPVRAVRGRLQGGRRAHGRGAGARGVAPLWRGGAQERLPHPPDLQHPPLGDGDAALHAASRGARSVAHARDDPARLLHDEAERHRRDDAGDLAGVGEPAPLRAARAGGGVPGDLRRSRADALGDHRSAGDVAAAERGLSGGVRWPAGHPRLSREPRPRGTATSA